MGGVLIPVLGFSWLYLEDTVTLFATLAAVVRLPTLRADHAGGATTGTRLVAAAVLPFLTCTQVVPLVSVVTSPGASEQASSARMPPSGPDVASRQPRARGYSHVVLTKHAYVTAAGARRPPKRLFASVSANCPRARPPSSPRKRRGGLHVQT